MGFEDRTHQVLMPAQQIPTVTLFTMQNESLNKRVSGGTLSKSIACNYNSTVNKTLLQKSTVKAMAWGILMLLKFSNLWTARTKKEKKMAQQLKVLAIRSEKQCSISKTDSWKLSSDLSLHVCHGNRVYMQTHVKIKFEEFNSREILSCQWINTRKCSYTALFAYVYGVWVVMCVYMWRSKVDNWVPPSLPPHLVYWDGSR